MVLFVFIFLIATLGFPVGIAYLLAEIFLNYSKDKATQEKIKNMFPNFQNASNKNEGLSFPDLQKTVGGKMSGSSAQGAKQGSTKTQTASNAVPKYTYTSNGSQVNGRNAGTQAAGNRAREPYARPVIKRRRGSTLATVGAVSLFGVSAILLGVVSTDVLHGLAESPEHFDLIHYVDNIPALIISIICLIMGIWLIYSKKRKIDRENRYIAIINQGYGMIPIDNICYLFPEKYDKCVQELQEMINSGALPGAYIDYSRRILVIDRNNSSVEPVIKDTHDVAATATGKSKAKGRKKISEQKIDFLSLERLSKRVMDEDIKMKLTRISTTLKMIGQKADEDPEIMKAAGVKTFMDMYLPKTIKLVEDYEEVNSISEMPKNNELKQNILDTLDAIDDAALTLWQDIIHSDMIDISSELDALQTKLILDGYKKSELEPDISQGEFTFDNMDISEEKPAARQAESDAEVSARRAEEHDAAMEADLFAKLRAEQEKQKETLK